jgi:hypothetical protein
LGFLLDRTFLSVVSFARKLSERLVTHMQIGRAADEAPSGRPLFPP